VAGVVLCFIKTFPAYPVSFWLTIVQSYLRQHP
jgi:hypothetical protein